MSKNTTDLNILDLARKLQCHSHGYMCQDCPQPDEPEIVRLLEQLISNREKLARKKALNDMTVWANNEMAKDWVRKELDGGSDE